MWCGAPGGRGYFMPESWAKLWTVALVPQDEEECAEERREAEKRRGQSSWRLCRPRASQVPRQLGGRTGRAEAGRRAAGLRSESLRAVPCPRSGRRVGRF